MKLLLASRGHRRLPQTGDLVIIGNQAAPQEIRNGYERNRLSVAVSKDEGKTWLHARTLFRSHVPAVGLLKPTEITGHIAIKDFVGEVPSDYATADYPNIHFYNDTILLHYDRNPRFEPQAGAYWTLRIFPTAALYK